MKGLLVSPLLLPGASSSAFEGESRRADVRLTADSGLSIDFLRCSAVPREELESVNEEGRDFPGRGGDDCIPSGMV